MRARRWFTGEFLLRAAVTEQDVAEDLRDANARAARVVGRVSLYVENLHLLREDESLSNALKLAQREVDRLESVLLEAEEFFASINSQPNRRSHDRMVRSTGTRTSGRRVQPRTSSRLPSRRRRDPRRLHRCPGRRARFMPAQWPPEPHHTSASEHALRQPRVCRERPRRPLLERRHL